MSLRDRVNEYTKKQKNIVQYLDKAKKYTPHAFALAGGLLAVKSFWDFMQGDPESVKNYVSNLKIPAAEVWIDNPFRQECLKIPPEFGTDFYAGKIINSVEQTALSAKEALASAGCFALSYASKLRAKEKDIKTEKQKSK